MNDRLKSDNHPLRLLPSVDEVLRQPELQALIQERGRDRICQWTRSLLERLREGVAHSESAKTRDEHLDAIVTNLCHQGARSDGLCRVINATGVALHTNLGRAPLPEAAVEAMRRAAAYTNLEMDLDEGKRRYRGYQLSEQWRQLTGAEDAFVVNNCASATLLVLQALAQGREVVVSRGQLIEIGGSYRLPDVFRMSGAILHEVGTTNRTRLVDYETAVNDQTAALLRVHESNYRIRGFSQSVSIEELVKLARKHALPAVDDLGSGAMIDLTPYGLPDEPTVPASLAAGADLALFSGDKLFGGPQCGVILGKQQLVEQVRKSPLARAVRIDKMTLAALHATLEIHLSGRALSEIPVLRTLTASPSSIKERANELLNRLGRLEHISASVVDVSGAAGGGSLPDAELPSAALSLQHSRYSAQELARALRTASPAVVGRVHHDALLLDVRTVFENEEDLLLDRIRHVAAEV